MNIKQLDDKLLNIGDFYIQNIQLQYGNFYKINATLIVRMKFDNFSSKYFEVEISAENNTFYVTIQDPKYRSIALAALAPYKSAIMNPGEHIGRFFPAHTNTKNIATIIKLS